MQNVQKEIDGIVRWLQDKLQETKTSGYVVGLSGGIDSSVAAALIHRAAGENALGIILPIHSNPEDANHAKAAAEAAGLRYYTQNLSQVHRSMLDSTIAGLQSLGEEQSPRLADANLRARLRMSAIYAAANSLNYLVIGTDNAAELYTGYFTKFGDGACDVLPLADFTKGEVRELGRALGVPEEIVNKPPSAGLWEGQTDEGEMGITYAEIDAFLQGEAIAGDVKAKLERIHAITEHKRQLPPIYRRQR